MHKLCPSGQMLAYGWGRNAPALTLPPGVGFEVGGSSGFTHAVLEARSVPAAHTSMYDAPSQVHYLRAPNAAQGTDSSGVIMHLTTAPVPHAAVRHTYMYDAVMQFSRRCSIRAS